MAKKSRPIEEIEADLLAGTVMIEIRKFFEDDLKKRELFKKSLIKMLNKWK
ncbi:MAG TPA: hypothetical protein VN922_19435 [Bacteroidia bacterium]|nr:hypothetical protein [Bacteroidia bacterium]